MEEKSTLQPTSLESDPFPPSGFDRWAAQYDSDVNKAGFPFTGYLQVLSETVRLADTRAGMTVLDLGAGTGNLAEMFIKLGCEVWCTDFSNEMLTVARAKIPEANFILHDLRLPFPPTLFCRFDRIVSAYVFHHFDLPEKINLIEKLTQGFLKPEGRLVIADISFLSQQALDTVRQATGDRWDDEPYWIVTDVQQALEAAKIDVSYIQVSECAGIYVFPR
jgi:cyclopropane fatty-acyl-phospholipid synthase-like methyltransferase